MARKANISAHDIEQQINHLAGDMSRRRRGFNKTFHNYTPAGNQERWAQMTARQRDRLNQINDMIDLHAQAVETKRQEARAALMPTSDDPSTQVAAELALQRIMARPSVKSADPTDRFREIRRQLENMDPSPSRTLMLNELVARGDLEADTVDAMLAQESPEYREANSLAVFAKNHQNVLRGKARQIGERLDSTPRIGSGGEQTLTGYDAATSVEHAAQSGAPTGHDVSYPVGTAVEMVDGPTVPDFD
ncbi:hypothetical protein PQI66_04400 [Corynebacterium sp. USCH3]|uniref:hypothetical protein n=1 Tax=Corynebacterium sp. USCH3 TaxID=3024840 RepID=UPI00309B920D